MTTFLVTRHKGAVEWARAQGIEAQHVTHLDTGTIKPGDHVLGTLPVSEVAVVCAHLGRYFHLVLDLPTEARGMELTAQDMDDYGAKLVEYDVREL